MPALGRDLKPIYNQLIVLLEISEGAKKKHRNINP